MMPVYRFVDPYNGTNVLYNHNRRPSYENFPPHMKGNPAMPPVSYEMPYANNLGYPVMPYPCCGHSYLPDHCEWRNSSPAYPYAPPNQFHCCGHHYPAFPQSYPVQYARPPHYTMNLPRYDYDKIVSGEHGYHCCGWPNHANNKRSSDNVKVEEQEPDDERKSSNSLIPVNQLKNNSYPIIWIPPDYLKDKENMKFDRSKAASRIKEEPVREARPAESQLMNSSISDPRWDGVPFDLRNLGGLVGDSNGKKAQNFQNEDKKEHLPFPLIWIPFYDNKNIKEETKDDKEPAALRTAEHLASPSGFFPFMLAEGGDKTNAPQAIQDYCSGQVDLDEKKSKGQKSMSVKQIEEPKVKAHSVDSMKSEPMYQENNVADKVSGTNAKGHSASPTKTSKLPPFCLRVDPLPKKKNGKVASRSPCPPGSKVRQEASKNQSSEHKENHQSFPAEYNKLGSDGSVEAKRKEGKVIPVVERKSSESEPLIIVTPITDSERKVTKETTEKQSEGKEMTQEATELMAEEESQTKEVAETRVSDKCEDKAGKKGFSDTEAALRIQSVYRGFTVRRWEPLKKLKEIAKVRDKVAEVRNQIQTLESSFDPHKDGRQKLIIGETIMSLLLKLDTIQGLHPSFREVRKSLARELITLQEKLDTFMVKESEEINETKAGENPATDCGLQAKEAEEQSINISSKSEDETNQLLDPVIAKYENNTFQEEARGPPVSYELSKQKQEKDVTGAEAVENPIMECVPSGYEAEASEKSESVETRIAVPDILDGKGQSEDFENNKPAVMQAVTQEESILEEDKQTKHEKNMPHPTSGDETMSLKEQADALAENLNDTNMIAVLENAEEESDNVSVSSPDYDVRDEDEQVLPAHTQSSIEGKDITDKRILEENQQLKEMVEKLLEAGQKQLDVISSLTGRVNDLEKKLSRKKKARSASFKLSPRPSGE